MAEDYSTPIQAGDAESSTVVPDNHADAELIRAVAEALEIKRDDGKSTDDDLKRLSELTDYVTTTAASTDAGRLAKAQLAQTEVADLVEEGCATDLVHSLLRDVVGDRGVLEPDGNLVGRARIEPSPVPPPSALRVEARTLRSADYAREVLEALIDRARKSDDVILHALARHASIEADSLLRYAVQAADRIEYLAEMLDPSEPEEARAAA